MPIANVRRLGLRIMVGRTVPVRTAHEPAVLCNLLPGLVDCLGLLARPAGPLAHLPDPHGLETPYLMIDRLYGILSANVGRERCTANPVTTIFSCCVIIVTTINTDARAVIVLIALGIFSI